MKHNILFFALIFVSLASVWAEEVIVCIDQSAPEAPGSLSLVGTTLQWNEAADEPAYCSGIAYYEVYENDALLGTTNLTFYTVNTTAAGTTFKVVAFDLANPPNQGAPAEYTVPAPPAPPSGGSSSGGGSTGGSSGGFSGGGITVPVTTPTNTTNVTGTTNQTGGNEGTGGENETLPNEVVNETPGEPQPPAPTQLGFTPYTIMVGALVIGLLALLFFKFK